MNMSDKIDILLDTGTNELELLEFILVDTDANGNKVKQSYGINVSKVRKIDTLPELTSLPEKGRGIIGGFFLPQVNDSFITAIDLGQYLFRTKRNVKDDRRIVIVAQFNQFLCGFVVDDINRIHRVSWKDVVAPKFENLESENALIVGVVHFDDRSLLLVDVEKIVIELGLITMAFEGKSKEDLISNPKIVLAEDSPLINKMIADRLRAIGCDITTFPNGLQAWEYLENISRKIEKGENPANLLNVVITDVEMPMMDGYSLTKRIKMDQYLQNIPVVIFSSMITDDVMHKGDSVGADAQISKPQIGELSDTIMMLVNHREEFISKKNKAKIIDDDYDEFDDD